MRCTVYGMATCYGECWFCQDTHELYEHAPLPSERALRLVRFREANLSCKCCICLEIGTYKLDDDPDYRALSYCWADAADLENTDIAEGRDSGDMLSSAVAQRPVYIAGKLFCVPGNVWDFLSCM